MLQVALQLVAVCALFGAAVHLHFSLRRRRNREWQAIVEGFVQGDGHLADLSYQIAVSEDIACAEEEIWPRIGGIHGLWTMYLNTEVLLEAIDFTARNCGESPCMAECLKRIREEGVQAQKLILLAILKWFLTALRPPAASSVATSARAYFRGIAHFGMALNDFRPDLLKPFRFHVAKA
jgi:hypothetical protein